MIGKVQMEREMIYFLWLPGKPCERSPAIGNNLQKKLFENKGEVMIGLGLLAERTEFALRLPVSALALQFAAIIQSEAQQ